MKKLRTFLLLAAVFGLAVSCSAQTDSTWQTDYKKAQEEAKASNKLLLMEFTGSDWCPPCMELEKAVLSNPKFQEYARKNLVLLELDFPRAKPQSPDVRKQNQELAERYGIQGFPSVIVFNADGKKIGEFIGLSPEMTVDWYIAQLNKLRKG